MSEFTASNGIGVEINEDEQIVFEVPNRPTSPVWLRNDEIDALREYIIAQEDKRLGRWRWPENRDYVVYRDHDAAYIEQPAVIVVNETTGGTAYAGNGSISASGVGASDEEMIDAAQAYFASRPEVKPWHRARNGEVWELTVGGHEADAYVATEDRFIHVERIRFAVDKDDAEITAGRCVWRQGDE